MKKYIRSDINSYSYTGSSFYDETEPLAHYLVKSKYGDMEDIDINLVNWYKDCYISVTDWLGESLYYKKYKMSDIDSAISDFNSQISKYDPDSKRRLSRRFIEQNLNLYGRSLDDYM